MSDPTLVELWNEVDGAWDDEAAHGRFLEYCQRTEQLGEAAARYAAARSDEGRRPLAQKRLDAIAILATSTLLASKRDTRPALPRWIVRLLLAAFVTLGFYSLFRALR
jgi:hypothetical protein